MTASKPRRSGTMFDKRKYGGTAQAIARVLRLKKNQIVLPKPPGLPKNVPARPNEGKPKF